MRPAYSKPAKIDPNCEIRLGTSSWDSSAKSVKYPWFDKNGKAARVVNFLVEALPHFAIRKGYISL
jgi:hypothetical protein